MRSSWIAERCVLNVIFVFLLNFSFAVLFHVSWALVSKWRKHRLQRFFFLFLAVVWKENGALWLHNCASAVAWVRISSSKLNMPFLSSILFESVVSVLWQLHFFLFFTRVHLAKMYLIISLLAAYQWITKAN